MDTTQTTPEAAARRRERINALTLPEAISALLFLSGFTPAGTDQALAHTWPPDLGPVACKTCGDSETELEPVVIIRLADGSSRTEYYCADYVACHDRRHPELAVLATAQVTR